MEKGEGTSCDKIGLRRSRAILNTSNYELEKTAAIRVNIRPPNKAAGSPKKGENFSQFFLIENLPVILGAKLACFEVNLALKEPEAFFL
ncbi:hypothetical protein J7L13_00455, partial [bacterium]|nr:hypothetical protein [bacterium]